MHACKDNDPACAENRCCSSAIALASLQGSESQHKLLSCGQPCHRILPDCNHLCTAPCHPAPCSGPCQQSVTVRCDCRRQRSKLPCSEARARLAAAGRSTSLDPSAAVRLLACDADCARAKVCPWRVHTTDGRE